METEPPECLHIFLIGKNQMNKSINVLAKERAKAYTNDVFSQLEGDEGCGFVDIYAAHYEGWLAGHASRDSEVAELNHRIMCEVKLNNLRAAGRADAIRAGESLQAQVALLEEALKFYAFAPCHHKLLEIAPKFKRPALDALEKLAELRNKK